MPKFARAFVAVWTWAAGLFGSSFRRLSRYELISMM
jgi:hypothetical protein